jgi:hypothetical protein
MVVSMRQFVPLAAFSLLALTGCASAQPAAVDTKEPAPTAIPGFDEAEAKQACRGAIVDSIDSYASTWNSADEVFDHDYDMNTVEIEAIDGGWKLSFMPRPNQDLAWSIPCEYVSGTATASWDWESRETVGH